VTCATELPAPHSPPFPPISPRVRDAGCMTKVTARPLAVATVLASLSLFAAACGGGPASNGVASLGKTTTTAQAALGAQSPDGGGQSPSAGAGGGVPVGGGVSATLRLGGSYTQDLKYAECLRSNGLPDFPDPSSNGTFQITSSSGAVPGSPQFQIAQKACRKFTPNGGAPPSPAQQARMLAQSLHYANCMRSHGITDFPDPQSSNGRVGFSITAGPGSDLNPNNPQFQAAQKACEKLLPGPPG
jgi:hypothetical protein